MNNDQERMARIIVSVITAIFGMMIAVVALAAHAIITALKDSALTLTTNLSLLAMVLTGLGVYSIAVALLNAGYCRAFWQLLGYDFAADDPDAEVVKDGDSA